MLLFTAQSSDSQASSWTQSHSFDGEGLSVEAHLGAGKHGVWVSAVDDESLGMAEVVSPHAMDPENEAVSSFHLPPYYRWERGGFSCEFVAEWREGRPSVAASLRHMQSLRPHPRALIVASADGAVTSAIVVGTPTEGGTRVDWRGWHVIDVDEPYVGPTRRIVTTHTRVRQSESLM